MLTSSSLRIACSQSQRYQARKPPKKLKVPAVGRYEHDSRTIVQLGYIGTMLASFEIVTCIAAIAGAVNLAAAEYRQLRRTRRCHEALRRTQCNDVLN